MPDPSGCLLLLHELNVRDLYPPDLSRYVDVTRLARQELYTSTPPQ